MRVTAWEPADWRRLEAWLWGVDLFNAFYFWEAHEAWEGLWITQPRDGVPATFLQGLIQVAAALLKIHARSIDGATALAQAGLDKIARTGRHVPSLLGLRPAEVWAQFTYYFGPLAERTLPPLDASVPRLTLAGEPEG